MNNTERQSHRKIPKGTIVLPRTHPDVELHDGDFSDTDARNMSPRRGVEDIERIAGKAKKTLKDLQSNLETHSQLKKKVENIEDEVDQLRNNNQRLQEQIEKQLQESGEGNL
jgi:predicted nuclease with TOPRIM domain